jgi:hypothetical protein
MIRVTVFNRDTNTVFFPYPAFFHVPILLSNKATMKSRFILPLFLTAVAILFAILYFQEKAGNSGIAASKADTTGKPEFFESFRLPLSLESFWSQRFRSVQLAQRYIKQFRDDASVINPLLTQQGLQKLTNSIWMDGASLERIDSLIRNAGCTGIRIYFAEYPRLADYPDPARPDNSLDRKFTLIIVTTKQDATGANVDSYTPLADGTVEGLYDYHDICPPTCPSVKSPLEP